MFRKIAVGMGIALAALLLVDQAVIPDSRKPKLRADAEARIARLEKGREILSRACAAAGGLEKWQGKHDVSFRLTDHWSLPVSVWPGSNVESTHYYLLHRNIGRVEMNTEKGFHQWGLLEGRPWALLNGEVDSPGVKQAEYAIKNFAYFFGLPFKFLDAGAYSEFVGEEIQNGRTYDKVYVSFGLNVGFYPTDWFLAYFDHATGRLASVIYTSVEKSPSFMEYVAAFDAYQEFEGLIVPTNVSVKMARPVSGIKIHEWQIRDLRFDAGLDETFFQLPNASQRHAVLSMSAH